MAEDPERPDVKVTDRRRFSFEGDPRQPDPENSSETASPASTEEPSDAPGAAASAAASAVVSSVLSESSSSSSPAGASAGSQSGSSSPSTHAEEPPAAGRMPAASMEVLILSLAMQAQLQLSIDENTDEEPPNLDIARHTVDMLGILQEKTKGNLSFEEQRLLENTLTELRFRYVQAVEFINKQAKS